MSDIACLAGAIELLIEFGSDPGPDDITRFGNGYGRTIVSRVHGLLSSSSQQWYFCPPLQQWLIIPLIVQCKSLTFDRVVERDGLY